MKRIQPETVNRFLRLVLTAKLSYRAAARESGIGATAAKKYLRAAKISSGRA